MLISNAYGYLALAIVFFIILNLNSFGDVSHAPHDITFRTGMIVFVVGVVTEWLGAKGRIFFMPVWLIGIFILGYWAYHEWGFAGFAIPVISSVALLVWWVKVCEKQDRETFAMAKRSLAEWREQADSLESIFFWDYVQRSLFFPISAHTREVCLHNQEVLARVWEKLSRSDSVQYDAPWREFEDFLTQVIKSGKNQLLDRKLQKKLMEGIQSQYLLDRH